MFFCRCVSSDAREKAFLSFRRRGDLDGGLFGVSTFVDGQCHASGGCQESGCRSLGRRTMSVFALPVGEGSVESSVRFSLGIGNSSVDVVGDLILSEKASLVAASTYLFNGESRTLIGMVPAEDMRTTVAICSSSLTLPRGDIVTSVL
jgi:hypothetical protein